MGILVSCQSITKSYHHRPLFTDISFGVEDSDRIGLIGPNGAGKSTLLKILHGIVEPDTGQVVSKKQLRTAFVAQEESFPADASIEDIVTAAAESAPFEHYERAAAIDSTLADMGFRHRQAKAGALSGGWRKRLALACALVQRPELLLMDEPTNHLDLEGVLWLEEFLQSTRCPYLLISHDRAFLESVTNRIIELNPTYPQGFISVKGPYSKFLLAKDEQLQAQQNLQQALESKVRREIAWLQRGAKARQTKARGRIQEAGRLIEQLAEVKERNSLVNPVQIGFDASGRKTRELINANGIKKTMGARLLFDDLSFIIAPGLKLGVVGRNGSGKTTLLKIIAGQLQPDAGTIKRAPDLKIVWFDQNRGELDQSQTLKDALSPTSDSVEYRGKRMHVSGWARKFLFDTNQLNLPVSRLSGGEQARILIAKLMLQPADILILDEPTNDLDIPSLTVLEESLQEFPGAVILVTHDRYVLDAVSTHVVGLNGEGKAEFFADYEQCEQAMNNFAGASTPARTAPAKAADSKGDRGPAAERKARLSTNETRELSNLPDKIETAEAALKSLQEELHNPDIASNYPRLQELQQQEEVAQKELDRLFARWEELEAKR